MNKTLAILVVMLLAGEIRGEDTLLLCGGGCGISNITVSVCMVTNAPIETDNGTAEYRMSQKLGYTIGCAVFGCEEDHDLVKAKPATERYMTTTILERKTLAFMWDGQQERIVRDREVSRKVKTFRKQEDWQEVTP